MNKPYSQNCKIKQPPSPSAHFKESTGQINFYCVLIVSFAMCAFAEAYNVTEMLET